MVCHIFTCLWVFFSQLSAAENEDAWIADESVRELPQNELYLTAFYFIITTFSTVGYGDISASNMYEKIFCIIVMVIGVTAFAAGTSSLTNLIQSYDQENSKLEEKV